MQLLDIINILISILNKNPLPFDLKPQWQRQGLKLLNFEDFKLVVELLPLVLQTQLLPVACFQLPGAKKQDPTATAMKVLFCPKVISDGINLWFWLFFYFILIFASSCAFYFNRPSSCL
jgi:hypothetical protein